jgi:tetrahydromethanopterin S-methyltransferase subunit G
MTNLQLLLTIGIPSLLVVLSWLSNNARFAALEKRLDALELKTDRKFEQIDRKFEEIDRRFDEMERRFEARFQEMELRFERRFQDVISAQHKDALVILQSMTSLHERVAVVEAKQALAA